MRLVSRLAIVATLLLSVGRASAADKPSTTAQPSDADEVTDHSLAVGHFGVGYFGEFDVPVTSKATMVPLQQVGVRYWLAERLAIDASLGLGISGGSNSGTSGTSVDKAGVFGLGLAGGIPVAFAVGKHYTFYVEPLARFGYVSQSSKDSGGNDTSGSGYRLVAGAAAGAEVAFGFIGIPQLSLNALVGLDIDIQGGSDKVPSAMGSQSESFNSRYFGTTVGNAPWDIFRTSVAAIYYF